MLLHVPALIFGIVNLKSGFFCRVRYRSEGEKKRLALTFDDGPEPSLTPAILDLLDEFKFTATFFVIARNVERYPEIIRETARRGHTIACHDLDHLITANFRRHRRMKADIGTASTIIASVLGRRPRLYRPPVGLSNPHLRTALGELGMECIGWDRSVGDGGNRLVRRFARISALGRPGSVVLLHDCLPVPQNREVFLSSLRALCEQMKQDGLTSVSVGSLFGIAEYR